MILTKRATFEAAHYLKGYKGKCKDMHGHSYILDVSYRGIDRDEQGIIADFKKIYLATELVAEIFDHKIINDVIEKQPSAENILLYIWDKLPEQIGNAKLYKLRLYETATSWVELFDQDIIDMKKIEEMRKNPNK